VQETWSRDKDNGLQWLATTWPDDNVRGLFSLRHGGCSEQPYATLNTSFAVGDDATRVVANRRLIAKELGGELSEWVVAQQVHGNRVHVATQADRGRGAFHLRSAVQQTDGLVTRCRNLTLVVLAADCVPVLFYDVAHQAIGAAHSGWKGTVSHVSVRVVAQMAAAYGTKPEDLHVWLGPSIRNCCYEVDAPVADPVRQSFGEGVLCPRRAQEGKYLLSLQACIRLDLEKEGIPSSQIHDTGLCTACHVDDLFSHRAEMGKTGRIVGAIRLATT